MLMYIQRVEYIMISMEDSSVVSSCGNKMQPAMCLQASSIATQEAHIQLFVYAPCATICKRKNTR